MNRIKELRKSKGLPQKALAADMEVRQTTISSWEDGRKIPSAKNLLKLADYFGVTVEYLMGTEPPKPPEPLKLLNVDLTMFGGAKKEQPGKSSRLPDDFIELVEAVRPLPLDVRHTALCLCKALVAELTLLQVSRKGNTVPVPPESDR